MLHVRLRYRMVNTVVPMWHRPWMSIFYFPLPTAGLAVVTILLRVVTPDTLLVAAALLVESAAALLG